MGLDKVFVQFTEYGLIGEQLGRLVVYHQDVDFLIQGVSDSCLLTVLPANVRWKLSFCVVSLPAVWRTKEYTKSCRSGLRHREYLPPILPIRSGKIFLRISSSAQAVHNSWTL